MEPAKEGSDTQIEDIVLNCDTDSIYQDFMEAARDGHGSEWINENGNLLCTGDLQTCVEQSHRISGNDFEKYINDHVANAGGPVYYNKTWEQVENIIGEVDCYEKYLLLSIDGSNLDMELGAFSTSQTSYSAVFLKQIKTQHTLSPTDTISFIKAMVPIGTGTSTKESIIFKIGKSTTNQYYDISDFPGDLPHYVVNPS